MGKRQFIDRVNSGTLTWEHTELGRRTACERYHALRAGYDYWKLLDVDWNPIGGLYRSLIEAQDRAEQHSAQRGRR